MTKPNAFSLIELSIVILIIGILIAGITAASSKVRESKLNIAKSLTQSSDVSSIPGLSLWLEPTMAESFPAADAADGATITKWKDINPQISSSLTATAQTGTIASPVDLPTDSTPAIPQITYKLDGINGIPTASFNVNTTLSNTTKRFTLSNIPMTNNSSTTFIVYQSLSSGSESTLIGNTNFSSNQGWEYGKTSTNVRYINFASSSGQSGFNGEPINTTPQIDTITISSSSSGSVIVYTNGVNNMPSGINNIVVGAPINFNISTGFYIGNYGNSSSSFFSAWKGYISEVIIYDRVLESDDRKSVEAYLGKKYGIKVR